MRLFYTDHFELPLPPGHRFPMSKYRQLRDRIVNDAFHSDDLLLVPQALNDEQLSSAHCRLYVDRVRTGTLSDAEVKRIGFPWSEKMVERSRRSSGATLGAATAALSEGISVNMAGGTHHAHFDAGEGFCVFNDAALTVRLLSQAGLVQRVAVIDCDVHQGNGTAQILRHDPHAFTFSIHGEKNFPLRQSPSHLDINLPDGTTDNNYLAALSAGLEQVLSSGPFDLAIYLAGADPFEGDRLGRLKLTKNGLQKRDELVLREMIRRDIPVAIAMAGGYATDIQDIVDIHATTIRVAKTFAS